MLSCYWIIIGFFYKSILILHLYWFSSFCGSFSKLFFQYYIRCFVFYYCYTINEFFLLCEFAFYFWIIIVSVVSFICYFDILSRLLIYLDLLIYKHKVIFFSISYVYQFLFNYCFSLYWYNLYCTHILAYFMSWFRRITFVIFSNDFLTL